MITRPKLIATPTCPNWPVFASTITAPQPAKTSAKVPIASAVRQRTMGRVIGRTSRAQRPAQLLDRLRDEPVERPRPAASRLDEARLAEDAQMVRDGRLRELECGVEVADADLAGGGCELVHEDDAGGIGERLELGRQRLSVVMCERRCRRPAADRREDGERLHRRTSMYHHRRSSMKGGRMKQSDCDCCCCGGKCC